MLLGGAGTVLGPLVGTALMFYLLDLASRVTDATLLVVGLALLAPRPLRPARPPRRAPRDGPAVAAVTLLEARGLTRHFGGLRAVEDVDFDLAAGEIHALIGPNGAGKTTFVSLLCGRLLPDAGTIRFDGRDITRLPAHARVRLGIAYTFQITAIYPRLPRLRQRRARRAARRPPRPRRRRPSPPSPASASTTAPRAPPAPSPTATSACSRSPWASRSARSS